MEREELFRNLEHTQMEKQTAIQEMMKNVENIMEENNQCHTEVKNLGDELKATKVLYEDLKVQKEDIIQKMDRALEESESKGKKAIEKINNEHKTLVDSIVKDHSSIVDDLKKSKVEAIEFIKKQHTKRMSDILTAKDEEHKQALEERDKKLKIMAQNEEMLKASYSEQVIVHVYCVLSSIVGLYTVLVDIMTVLYSDENLL